MAKVKYADRLIRLRCTVCKRANYYSKKNKKKVEDQREPLQTLPRRDAETT